MGLEEMRLSTRCLLALVVLPASASAFTGGSTSTAVSRESLVNSERGASVASLISSQGGEFGKALGTGSKLASPVRIKDYLATTTCTSNTPSSTGLPSLAVARANESRAAGVARCDLLCKRIKRLPYDDPQLDTLTAAWVVEALQVAANTAADATSPSQPADLSGTPLTPVPPRAPAIENVRARFFMPLEATYRWKDVPVKTTLACPPGQQQRPTSAPGTDKSEFDYARGLQLWTRVAEALPPQSGLDSYAHDWIRLYRQTSSFAGCEKWEALLTALRWNTSLMKQTKVE